MSHVRIALYDVVTGSATEVGDLAEEGMLPIFRSQPGFVSYGLAETDDGKLVSVSQWESGDQAHKAGELAAGWIKENLADRVRLESSHLADFLFYATA